MVKLERQTLQGTYAFQFQSPTKEDISKTNNVIHLPQVKLTIKIPSAATDIN